MSKRLYKYVIFLLILLPVYLSTQAQENGKDSLQAAFSRYRSQAPQEKLFVHIDRTFYLAGETIWFKVYDIDGSSNKPLALSGIAYVEVLDKDQRPVLQAKIGITDGKGDGSFRIPLTIPSGEFVFRAYTNWMKNFSSDFYFLQRLTILNTVNDAGTDDSSRLSHSVDSSHAAIRLFPEGGNIVNGLTSVIACKATDRFGNAISCDGIIRNQKGDTVVRFRTGRQGIGKFSFTPVKGNTYYAVAEIDQSPLTQQLPAAFDQGYVMHLDNENGNRLRITVHAAGTPAIPALYLLVHTRSQLKNAQVNFLTGNEAIFYLDKDSLGDGVSHITVFDGDRSPVCERLYFKQPRQQLNIGITAPSAQPPSPANVTAPSAQPPPANALSSSYPTRTGLSIGLSTTDSSGHPVPADLSMSVFLLDSLQSIPRGNILTYLLLISDLKGQLESPLDDITETSPAATEALDDLMLTQGWTRFRWEDILTNKKPYFEFLPETNGPIINAKVIDKRTGRPSSPVIGYLSLPGQHFKLATALSQPDGSLFFHLDNFYGNKEMIVQTNSQTDSNCRIDLVNPFSDRASYIPLADPAYAKKWSRQLLERSINTQAENAYLIGQKHRYLPGDEDTTMFFGRPDLHFNLDDYTRFATLDEIIREYVDNVRVRLGSGHTYFRVRNALFNLFFDADPLLLIDGVPVFNGDKMIATDPEKIKKIDVVSHKYFFGPSISDGIVSFSSYDGDLAGYELDPNAIAVQYNGLEQKREFYTPVYAGGSRGQTTIPDFRNQLLWAPDITTDAAGNRQIPLNTSDLTGKFALIVQGITREGLAGYSVMTFTVAPSSLSQ
jgi:hypothetical protein